ncbi:MAG: type I methionyl aminopeptidase [Deltaproteobacteria bacterium]|nr:type I methionyl aminopeptidase [Deltaproteobacteria bacterium]
MIILKSAAEIETMRRSGVIVAEVLRVLQDNVRPGSTTMDLERIAEEEIKKRRALPAFKGYKGYPFCLCTSLNNEVVHGMPSVKKVLKEGDIISMDCGVFFDGFYGDSAVTVGVGNISENATRLIEATATSLDKAIEQAMEGNRLYDISHAVQRFVEARGYSVVRDFVGHGIGRELHEPPQVPNFGPPGKGAKLKAGMVLAIEPMINLGDCSVNVLNDGWTAVTADGKLSAHFEHTVAITAKGPYVLTRI